jgi:exonuclease SbcC
MIPVRLTISGFLSYRDPVELDFAGFDLACISGPNGAGKSSLLDAITWALFGQARKRDDSVINSDPQVKAAEVHLVFAYEGNLYQVTRSNPRGKVSVLEFYIFQDNGTGTTQERILNYMRLPSNAVPWKPLTERTLRDTQARIENILRMDYETFVNASFFLQGKADLFTQQRASDRKRILSNILGLEIWEIYRQRATEMRKDIEVDSVALDGRLKEIEAELGEEQERVKRLDELKKELENLVKLRLQQEGVLENYRKIAATLDGQRKLAEALRRRLEVSERNLEGYKTRLENLWTQRDQHHQVIQQANRIEEAYTAWQEQRLELERWEQVAKRFREQEKRRQEPLNEINAERARLEQEQRSLEGQLGDVIEQEATLPVLIQQVAALSNDLKEADNRLEQRNHWESRLEEARREQAEARAENPRLRGEMEEIKARIDQLNAAPSPVCPLCGQPLSLEERQKLIDELAEQGKAMGDRFRGNAELLANSNQLVGEIEAQIRSLASLEKERLALTENLTRLDARQKQVQQLRTQWEAESAARLEAIKADLEEQNYAAAPRKRLAEIDTDLIAIGYDASTHDQVRLQESQGRTAESAYRLLENARAAIQPIESEIANLETQVAGLEDELPNQRQEANQAANSLIEAQAQAPDMQKAESELRDLQERENHLRLEVGAAQQKVEVLADLKTRRESLVIQREEKNLFIVRYKQLEHAFSKDGIPALLIEQALPQIEARANETLDRLTAGEMSVRFITQAAFKDKKREDLRETLDIQISDPAGKRDYEMFSGGEAFRVNFAIRLALSEVLAQRAGARLQTLVIDEGFGSQDAQGRQRLIEAINLVRQDFAKILVITHIDELKDSFPTRIEVEKTPHGSTLRLV